MSITSIDMPKFTFTHGYKSDAFLLWYENGKPGARSLRNMLNPDPTNGRIPNSSALTTWIKNDFRPKAVGLDQVVANDMADKLVQSKVEMLARHAVIGKEMQDIAIKYLNDNLEEITPSVAAKLLIEGIKIERISLGIPDMLEKMTEMTDDELLGDLKKMLTSGKVTIEPND